MPYSATVFNVLIASPSDVPEEREAIAQSLNEWNSLNSQTMSTVLLPVMWESHSAPAMGDRPQGIINNQVVRNCDMLIGAFWTRLGSPTGIEESGTVEEIKWFLKQNKPVMLYYSKQHVDLDKIDTQQLEKLKAFKISIKDKGIQDHYSSIYELKQKLARHLTIVNRDMTISPIVNASLVKAARASTREASELSDTFPTSSGEIITPDIPKEMTGKGKVSVKDYEKDGKVKSFLVSGDTKMIKDKLKEMGGRWNGALGGWIFSKTKEVEVTDFLIKSLYLSVGELL